MERILAVYLSRTVNFHPLSFAIQPALLKLGSPYFY